MRGPEALPSQLSPLSVGGAATQGAAAAIVDGATGRALRRTGRRNTDASVVAARIAPGARAAVEQGAAAAAAYSCVASTIATRRARPRSSRTLISAAGNRMRQIFVGEEVQSPPARTRRGEPPRSVPGRPWHQPWPPRASEPSPKTRSTRHRTLARGRRRSADDSRHEWRSSRRPLAC
jgi:hypothetical protein